MKTTLTLIALAAAALTTLTAQAAETKKLTVNGMVCAFCAQGIEKRLTALPTTQAVYVNLGQKVVAVQAKDGQTLDEAKLRHEVTEAGYDVIKVESSAQTVEAIRAEMQGKK
jgi:cation transport ATPase